MPEYPIDPMDEFTLCPLEDEVGSLLVEEVTMYLRGVALKDRFTREVLPVVKKYGMYMLEGLSNSGTMLGIYRPPRYWSILAYTT